MGHGQGCATMKHLKVDKSSQERQCKFSTMAEVCSVLATVAQLTEYVPKLFSALHEAYKTVKHGAKLLNARIDQVARLIETANIVKENEQLHTPLVDQQLQVILNEAEALLVVLFAAISACTTGSLQRRFWKALRKQHEESILQAFNKLEKEKATLQFCISLASAESLSGLHRSMNWITGARPSKRQRRDSGKRVSLEILNGIVQGLR